MIIQLNPPIFLETPLGSAQAYFMMECPDEIWWQCFQEKTGESWWWPNNMVRASKNLSTHRYKVSSIAVPKDLDDALAPHRKRYK